MQRCFYSSIFTLLAIIFISAAVLFPMLTVPFALISTTLFAFVSALSYTKASRLCSQCIVAIFYIVTLVVTKDPVPGLMMLMFFFPVGWAVGTACMSRRRLNTAGAMAILGGSIFFFAVFVVYAIFSTYPDISFSVAAENIKEMILPDIEAVLASLFEVESGLAGEYDYSYIYSFDMLASFIYTYIPTVIGFWFVGSAAVSFWLLKAVFKLFDQDVSFMGRFNDFKVTKTGAFIYFLSTVVTVLAAGSALGTAAVNFSGVMSVVLAYAGVSLISFLLELKNVSDLLRYFIVGGLLIVGIMPFGFSYILSFVGLIDAYLDIRERLNNSGV